MPKKTGRCEIAGCRNTPTDWHHVISQNQIKKRGLPKSFFTDPGNLKEYCRKHHDMTTASMDRKRLEKQAKKKVKAKPKKAKKSKPKKKAGKFDDLRKIYPPDHWLHDDESWDQDLSLDFEIAGGRWTKNGGATLPPKTKRGRRIVIPPPENWPEEW